VRIFYHLENICWLYYRPRKANYKIENIIRHSLTNNIKEL